ncbi:MAG: tetratricopeptide repeat protein [Myxococcales bacterium]|nr:tetratricopeptide repeat protein [Myxococcales bacterium]MCB9581027.1 tetratricopeptide repeat protein [Polyangiaceae bacterium]
MTEGPNSLFGVSDLRAPLIGRQAVLGELKKASDAALGEQVSRVVTLLGAGGLGKSRIIHEFLLELRVGGGRLPRVFRGSARSIQLSYGVFARLFRSRFGLVEGMDPEAAKAQVRAQVAQVLDDRKVGDVCYFLGQLMDLEFLESPLTKAVAEDPLQAGLLRRAIVKNFLDSDAARGPLCLVFEDLHLADDDSIELLRYLMEHLGGPILILCATRPDLLARHEDWFDFAKARHTRVDVEPLSEEDSLAVANALLAPCENGPPEALVESAVGMAGGNPGLLEQMVRIFHDTGVLDERDALARDPVWKVNLDKLASARLPLTVDDAVAARIAALGSPERRLLEHAAAMGSVFWLGGLVALARSEREAPELWSADAMKDIEELRLLLAELVERDYVLELPDSAFSGEVEYVFKHNLEREKVAQLTSAASCRRYNQVIADWLAQKDGVRSQEEYCAMLAQHLEKAGAMARAGVTYLEAGDLARSTYAAKKAHELYGKGLSLLGEMDAPRRIEALHNHGDVLTLLGRTDEALAAFREMQSLAYRLGLRGKGGAAHNRIGRLHRDTGSLSLAMKHLETARGLFESANDERGISSCHDDIGKVLWLKGEYDEALEEMRRSLEMRKKIGDRRSIALSLNNIGLVWMDHGRTAKAGEALEAALTIRREIGDPLGIVQSLNNLGKLAQELGENTKALEHFTEAHEVAREMGEQNRIAVVLTNIGETHYRMDATEEAIRILKQAEELCDEMGDKLHLAEAKRGLAKAYLMQKELRKARDSIKHAVDLFGQVRSKSHLATALRTLGEITAAGAWGAGHEGKAIDYFMRSIALCKEIGNELEVAKSYRAFASYVQSSDHYRQNADIQREAQKLSGMADEIFERHRRAAQAANN